MVSPDAVPDITDGHVANLNDRQRLDYQNYCEELFTWLCAVTQQPFNTAQQLAFQTVSATPTQTQPTTGSHHSSSRGTSLSEHYRHARMEQFSSKHFLTKGKICLNSVGLYILPPRTSVPIDHE